MNLQRIVLSAALVGAAIGGSGSDVRAQSNTLTYGCGPSPGITISVDPTTGKGTFADATAQGDFARAPLVPDQKGAWVNDKLGIVFLPESRPPTVSAGDAEFRCKPKAAAAAPAKPGTAPAAAAKPAPAPVAATVATYKCAAIVVAIDEAKGTGTYKDRTAPQFAGQLTRQKDGTWRAKDDGAIFDPKAKTPAFEAGDAEFKCTKAAKP